MVILPIERAVAAIRESMTLEPWDPKYDVVEIRLIRHEGRLVWAAFVEIPMDPDSPSSGVSVDCEISEVVWR